MKLNEATASARRIGPIPAIDGDGNPVTDFSAAGAKEISVNDADWVATADNVVVINNPDDTPSGYVYLQGSAGDASVPGFVAVKLSQVCRERVIREEVELAPQGIPVGTDDATLLRIGPLEAKDVSGNPVVGGVGIDVVITINGAKFQAPLGNLVEIDAASGEGFYDLLLDPTEATAVGWVAAKMSGACQEFMMRVDIVAPVSLAGDVVPPTTALVSPPEGDAANDAEIVIDVEDDLEIAYIGVYARPGGTTRRVAVFRRGVFEPGFSVASFVEAVAGPGVTSRLHIIPDDEWPPGELKIDVDPVDGGGNVGA